MTAKIVLVLEAPVEIELAQDLVPPGFELLITRSGSPEFNDAIPDMHYLLGMGNRAMDATFYARAKNLKLVQLLSAGYDTCDVEAAKNAGIPIANNGGANSSAVAEHTMMLAIGCSRRLFWQHTNVVSGRWRGNNWTEKHVHEIEGKMLGIIGLGTIGKKVARLGRAFGMQVQYYDVVRLPEDAADALGVKFRLFNEVLRSSDIVSLHVPLSPATHHMMNAESLALMKPSSILVNTCRGPVVDEVALHAALTSGALFAAGLDVFEREPPEADNPLFALENVLLTAHLAGPTLENRFKRIRNAFDNVQRVERGDTPLWVIPELRDLPSVRR